MKSNHSGAFLNTPLVRLGDYIQRSTVNNRDEKYGIELIEGVTIIISNNSKTKYKMYPIEVKSGPRYSTDSLMKFKEKYKSRIGCCYIIHPRNLIVKDDIICIPPYMTICL